MQGVAESASEVRILLSSIQTSLAVSMSSMTNIYRYEYSITTTDDVQ